MIYIVLPVHNRAAVTARFLESLSVQTFTQYQLILVNDGCTDDTEAIARLAVPDDKLVVLRGDGTLWWAGALHLAWQHLRKVKIDSKDSILIANDDMTFGREFLNAGLALLDNNAIACIQAVGIDRSSGIADHGAIVNLGLLRFRAALPTEKPNCLSTRGLIMRIKTFIDSGGMKPNWLPHYLSDYEFTLRLHRRGAVLLTDPSFTAVVDLQLTGTEAYGGRGVRQFLTRTFTNKAKFNPKHLSAFAILVCPIWFAPIVLARIWLRFLIGMFAAIFAVKKLQPK